MLQDPVSVKWRREPLIHFLLLGGVLFALNALVNRDAATPVADPIVVRSVEIERLKQIWRRNHKADPTEAELDELVERLVREKILYREALKLGLDKDDAIVRQRMVSKMEFLTGETDEPVEATDGELRKYFEANAERYRLGTRVSFEHTYFSKELRKRSIWKDAREALATLREHAEQPPASIGDPFDLDDEYVLQSRPDAERLFGAGFADSLFAAPSDEWTGPLESRFGLHVVRVTERRDPELPPFESVIEQLREDFSSNRRTELDQARYEQIRRRYEVLIAPDAQGSEDTPP